MSDLITVSGLVATTPRHIVTGEGLPITSFRLASAQRRFDRGSQRWVDGETNWYTITVFRQLAINSAASIVKGDRVVLAGRLRIREWENADRSGTAIEIEASSLGHDLAWGTAQFSRTITSGGNSTKATENAAGETFPAEISEELRSELGAAADPDAIATKQIISEELASVPF